MASQQPSGSSSGNGMNNPGPSPGPSRGDKGGSCDSDLGEEDEGMDESLEMSRRDYNQQLSDAFKDGYREGFDKGQLQHAQAAFNTAHSAAALAQLPYGQYLGLIKVLESLISSPGHVDSASFSAIKQDKSPVTQQSLQLRLDKLLELNVVHQNPNLNTYLLSIKQSLPV